MVIKENRRSLGIAGADGSASGVLSPSPRALVDGGVRFPRRRLVAGVVPGRLSRSRGFACPETSIAFHHGARRE
jgi:hypothetical protein